MGLYDHSDNKVYIVTLEDKSDLEGFYSDMASDGYTLHRKRPISRSTEYYMNSTQAEDGIRDLVRSRGLGDVYKRQYSYSTLYFY